MKILLIVPPEDTYIRASVNPALDRGREHRPFLGLLSILVSLRNARPDLTVQFLDCRTEEMDLEGLMEAVSRIQPDLVGITCLTFFYPDAIQTADAVKQVLPSTHVCLGGFHVGLYPEETLSQPSVDFVVIGEGERTFLDLVNTLSGSGLNLANIPGLGYRVGQQLVLNPPRPVITDLDELPHPDYEGSPWQRYTHLMGHGDVTLAIESSRGCPYGCVFCDIRRTRFRVRRPETVVAAIESGVQKGVRSFFFVDDNLTIQKPRVLEICRLIRERRLDIEFKVSSRVDTLDDDILRALKMAGCSRVSLGIETSHPKYLEFLGKGFTLARIEQTLAAARRVGLPVFAYMMIGFPGETAEEMRTEVTFLRRNRVEYANFSILTVYPKTALHDWAVREGLMKDDPWVAFARDPHIAVEAPLVNGLYTREELDDLQAKLMRSFYFTPWALWRRLREVNSWSGFTQRVRIAWRLMKDGG